MKVISEVDILGRWEIAVETNNEQEQSILKDKINEVGADFMESGISEIIIYADGPQKIKLISFISENKDI